MKLFRREPATTTAAPDPEVLLHAALGATLADVARMALARARCGISPGRVGRTYSSGAEAGVDSTLEDVERALVQERAALDRARAVAQSDLSSTLRTTTVERVDEIESRVLKLERRLTILRGVAPALARRFAIVESLDAAESEARELEAKLTELRHTRDDLKSRHSLAVMAFAMLLPPLVGGCSGGDSAMTPAGSTAEPPPSGVHMLDTTGCQDFPSGDVYNRTVVYATVASNSAALISAATSRNNGSPGIAGPYHYEVVPVDAATVTVHPSTTSTSPYHTFPYGWPIPSDGSQLIASDDDHVMELVQQTTPSCTFWEGYDFTLSGSIWSAYSGAMLSAGSDMPTGVCAGAGDLCGENMEGDLTYYEATSGQPILHAFHMETPASVSCDGNNTTNCMPLNARLRLQAGYPEPTDPNAKAVIDALKQFGGVPSDNGCCWNIIGISSLAQGTSFPSAVTSALGGLHWSNFDVVIGY